MNIGSIKTGLKTLRAVVSKNSPAITAGIAVAAMGGAIWQAIKATKKIDDMMLKAFSAKNEKAITDAMQCADVDKREDMVELTATEKAVVFARAYWPAAALFILATTCIVGSVCLANQQIKALALMATTAESALDKYEEAAKEVVGEKKAGDIRDRLNQNRVTQNPPPSDDLIVDTQRGRTLCYDPLSGRYFYSDIDFIRQQINKLNEELLDQNFVSLNDYYEAIGLDPVRYGSDHGWHYSSNGAYGAQIRVKYTSAVVTPDGRRTAFVVDVQTEPGADYTDDLY